MTKHVVHIIFALSIASCIDAICLAKPKSKNHKGAHLQQLRMVAQQEAEQEKLLLQKKQLIQQSISRSTFKEDVCRIAEEGAMGLLTNSMFAGTLYMYANTPKKDLGSHVTFGLYTATQMAGNIMICCNIRDRVDRIIQRYKFSDK